jgi:hypothetical protein
VSFHVIREVEAESRDEAMVNAIEVVGNEALAFGFLNKKNDRPLLFAVNAYPLDLIDEDNSPFTSEVRKTIVEARSSKRPIFMKEGFLFYKESPWQRLTKFFFQVRKNQWEKPS